MLEPLSFLTNQTIYDSDNIPFDLVCHPFANTHVISLEINVLAHEFQDKGLDGVVSSWIGTGENLPISAEQLTSVLGSSHLQEMAQKVGLPVDGLTEKLSVLPPQVVDQLTPTGSVPEEGGLLAQGMGMLGGLLK